MFLNFSRCFYLKQFAGHLYIHKPLCTFPGNQNHDRDNIAKDQDGFYGTKTSKRAQILLFSNEWPKNKNPQDD